MAATSTPANMIRRTLNNRLGSQISSFAEGSPRAIRPFASGSIRSIHNSARLPTITASEVRHRPTLRPHQLSTSQTGVNGQPSIGKRSIFIQTETTPNPDVSLGNFLLYLQERNLTISLLTAGLEIYPKPQSPARGLYDLVFGVPFSTLHTCSSPSFLAGRKPI